MAGIGGSGMGPLAQMARDLGYEISGSDLVDSTSIEKIRNWSTKPLINIGQTAKQISDLHQKKPIDWYVYSSALAWASPPNEELEWVKKQAGIKASKRDQFLNHLIEKNNLKLIAVTGSHGKTTTTALLIWAFKQLGEKISYALGGKLISQPSAEIVKDSQWFIYEADEFDRNFLSFSPQIGVISGLDYDHVEVYPDLKSYHDAFKQFINRSQKIFIIDDDLNKLYNQATKSEKIQQVQVREPDRGLKLLGKVNRQNAQLALEVIKFVKPEIDSQEIIDSLNSFKGSWRRFEKIAHNVFSDYAHNPVKIAGCLQIASELKKPIVVVYEPHSHRRQIYVKDQYKDLFKSVKKLYWLPSHPAREDPNLKPLSPQELINSLNNPQIAQEARMDDELKNNLKQHIKQGDIVVGMSASGLDEWLKLNLGNKDYLKF